MCVYRFTSIREARRITHETAFRKGEDKTQHQLSYQQMQYTKVLHTLRAQLLRGSEQERAAHALASAKESITLLAARLEQHTSATTGGTAAGAASSKQIRSNSISGVSTNSDSSSASSSVADLSERASRLEAVVMTRTHELLSQVLVSSASPIQPAHTHATDSSDMNSEQLQQQQKEEEAAREAESSIRALRSRVLGHVLRTLYVLNRGDVAQAILAENVVYPLARYVVCSVLIIYMS